MTLVLHVPWHLGGDLANALLDLANSLLDYVHHSATSSQSCQSYVFLMNSNFSSITSILSLLPAFMRSVRNRRALDCVESFYRKNCHVQQFFSFFAKIEEEA